MKDDFLYKYRGVIYRKDKLLFNKEYRKVE